MMIPSENKDEEFLAEHTIAMRKALEACQVLLLHADQGQSEKPNTFSRRIDPQTAAQARLKNLHHCRLLALEAWKQNDARNAEQLMETIHLLDDDSQSDNDTWNFRQRFHHSNQPCRILGLAESCFARVQKLWGSPLKFRTFMHDVIAIQDDNDKCLPVRRSSTHSPAPTSSLSETEATLDAEGRAMECEIVLMSLGEWIVYLDQQREVKSTGDEDRDYLKDWHFEQWLMETQNEVPLLYQVPDVFQHDLLDPFLRVFTNGDYRFVYWGPAGSCTPWHSDVLHSFSWSYNVFGSKEWTFQVPHCNRQVKIVQNAGEGIFVPATWKHQVVNLEETLSINRNWITAANLDLCWDCLVTEMALIERELDAWVDTGSSHDWESHECMLRGCVGLSVTAFYLMVLYRLAIIMKESEIAETGENLPPSRAFEVVRCIETLQSIFNSKSVCLEERLQATLARADLAKQAVELGRSAVTRGMASS